MALCFACSVGAKSDLVRSLANTCQVMVSNAVQFWCQAVHLIQRWYNDPIIVPDQKALKTPWLTCFVRHCTIPVLENIGFPHFDPIIDAHTLLFGLGLEYQFTGFPTCSHPLSSPLQEQYICIAKFFGQKSTVA